MRSLSYRLAVALLSLSFFSIGCDHASDRLERRTVEGTSRAYWIDGGFVEMVPPVRPPSNAMGSDLIEVWIDIGGGSIDVERDASRAWLPRMPPGARLDRLELEAGPSDAASVVDVRGTDLDAHGAQRFHVLEPEAGDRLLGVAWAKSDARDQRDGDAALRLLLADERAPDTEIDRMVALNQCASCHGARKPIERKASGGLPNRATDASGFYAILSVLEDETVLETSRPRNMNLDDPFMSFRCCAAGDKACAASPERVDSAAGGRLLACGDGTAPTAQLDLARALEAGDAHAAKVCGSRRYLFDHMTLDARRAFRTAFHECGIDNEAPDGASEGILK